MVADDNTGIVRIERQCNQQAPKREKSPSAAVSNPMIPKQVNFLICNYLINKMIKGNIKIKRRT